MDDTELATDDAGSATDTGGRLGFLLFLFAALAILLGLAATAFLPGPDLGDACSAASSLASPRSNVPVLQGAADQQVNSCIETVTDGAGSDGAHYEEVTPQAPSSEGDGGGDGDATEETHDAAADGLAVGQGSGGVGNPLNPQARPTTPRQQGPTHVEPPPPPPEVIIVVPDTTHATTPDTSHDTMPHDPNSVCDPSSPNYDPHEICL